ncbi:hypothetical protein S40293_07375 [Stachybotrys chartarum IBT 40293]|nr:hypothetical protein S40293_07375 [Stachybotrys chartarum IBT 40293]
MSASHRQNRILAPLDVIELQNQGLVGNSNETDTHRLHKRRLNRSSDEENRNIPLDIPLQSEAAEDAFVTIPKQLISLATLEYIGFSRMKASQLWDTWTNWPLDGPRRETDPDDGSLEMTFIHFITGIFDTSTDTCSNNDADWISCMQSFGLSQELQLAIVDPVFKYLRLSDSCSAWAKDTVQMRFAGLELIRSASLEREKSLQRASGRSGGSHGATSGPSRSQSRSASGIQRASSSNVSISTLTSASAVAARNAPGFTTLYKGIDQARIEGLLGEDGKLKDVQTLLSNPPSDFSGRGAMFYFTPNFEVAQYYAAYAKRRAGSESVVIITIAIPNRVIQAMDAPELQRIYWPSPEWKELVWSSRNQNNLRGSLRRSRKATLIIGNIARKPNLSYHRLDSWEQISEDYVLKVDGANGQACAIQFVFTGEEEGDDFLKEHLSDRTKVFLFTRTEVDAWVAQNQNAFAWMSSRQ